MFVPSLFFPPDFFNGARRDFSALTRFDLGVKAGRYLNSHSRSNRVHFLNCHDIDSNLKLLRKNQLPLQSATCTIAFFKSIRKPGHNFCFDILIYALQAFLMVLIATL